MAIVINADLNPSNIGKVVKVIKMVDIPLDEPRWYVEGDVLRGTKEKRQHGWAACKESHLMRIDGEDFNGEENTVNIKINLTKEKHNA